MTGPDAPRRLVLAFPDEQISVDAELPETQARSHCTAVWQRLPAEGFRVHGIYTESEASFSSPEFV